MAGGGGFNRLDTVYFDAAIEQLRSGCELFESTKNKLDSTTKQLFDHWEGDAAMEYYDKYKRLKRYLRDENDNLRDIIKCLEDFYESYLKWDTDEASQIKSSYQTPPTPSI